MVAWIAFGEGSSSKNNCCEAMRSSPLFEVALVLSEGGPTRPWHKEAMEVIEAAADILTWRFGVAEPWHVTKLAKLIAAEDVKKRPEGRLL